MSRLFRVATGIAAAVCLAACGTSVDVEPAGMTSQAITITDEVRIRPNPNTNDAPLAMMPAGANPTYVCYADGEYVGGTTKWFRVGWNGVTGYYSSIADDVPVELQNNIERNYGIPRCGTGTDINQGSGADSTVNPAPLNYDRAAAARWAVEHAQDPRLPRFADCTWLVSQALWYGGFHQTDQWNMSDHHGFPLWPVPGTPAATAAPELVKYLKERISVTITPLNFSTNAVPQAQPGDIIAYKWQPGPEFDSNGSDFDHLSLVTNIAAGQYPEVSEWGVVDYRMPYVRRGWTWSEKDHVWLQQKAPGVAAVLIHFS